jgi:hypothetical protein
MKPSYLLLILAITISSCSFESKIERKLRKAERKIEKLTIKYPQLLQKDTLYDTVSIVTKEVKIDTSFIDIPGDTTYVYRDKLRIKYVKVGDTVHIQGECKGDTVIQVVKVPFDKVVVREQGIVKQLTNSVKGIAVSLLLIVLVILGLRFTFKLLT